MRRRAIHAVPQTLSHNMQFYMRQFATKKYLAIGGALLVLVLLALFSLSRTSNRVPAQQFEPTFEYVSHEGPGYRMEYPGWWMREAFEGGMFVTNEYGSARVIVNTREPCWRNFLTQGISKR